MKKTDKRIHKLYDDIATLEPALTKVSGSLDYERFTDDDFLEEYNDYNHIRECYDLNVENIWESENAYRDESEVRAKLASAWNRNITPNDVREES